MAVYEVGEVAHVVARYAARPRAVQCWDADAVRDQCFEHAQAFVMECETQGLTDTEVVSGFVMDGNVIVSGHAATRLGQYVVDWTARQFNPVAPVPDIVLYARWREVWRTP